jgi:hypothetical protein
MPLICFQGKNGRRFAFFCGGVAKAVVNKAGKEEGKNYNKATKEVVCGHSGWYMSC